MDKKDNLFGVIRYWAAYSVLMLHYVCFWRIYNGYLYEVEEYYNRVTVFTPVVIFIAISGYLTAVSLDRSPDLKTFFLKRFKRIYIPLWICMAVYLAVYLVIAKGFIDHTIIRWLALGVLGIAYTPPCLQNFASGSANGVLWTITVLIELYAVTALLWKYIKRVSEKFTGVILLIGLALLNVVSQYASSDIFGSLGNKLLERSFFPYAAFFYTGVFIYSKREKLKGTIPFVGIAAIVLGILMTVLNIPDYGYYTGIIRGMLTAFAAVCIGAWSPADVGDNGAARMWGLFGRYDITYEVYLYQWLIINIFIYLGWYESLEWDVLRIRLIFATAAISIVMHLVTWGIFMLTGRRNDRKEA